MRERSRARGGLVGLASASVVVALMFGVRLVLGWQALPDVAADTMTLILPGAVFGFLIDRLQELGRPLMLVGLSAGLLVLGAGAGLVSVRLLGAWPRVGRVAAATLALSALTVPVVFVGRDPQMAAEPALTSLVYWLLFAILLEWGLSSASGRRVLVGAPSPSRRALLYGAGALGAAWLSSYLGSRLAHTIQLGGARPLSPGALPATPTLPAPGATSAALEDPFANATFLTSTKDFYVISKNGVEDPKVDPARWRLEVGGDQPYALSYSELRALPGVEGTWTLECISNLVGGGLISTARFRGVPLSDLLARAGVPASTREIRFVCADGYTESIPLETANDQRTIVAYLMNDEPLTREHGFPARLLMSGRYGMKNPKWLNTIAPLSQVFNGYWEQRGWNRDAFVLTTSQIQNPSDGQEIPAGRPYPFMGGVAFAGARGISRVEVSFDGGTTWTDARLRTKLPKDNWVPWTHVWTPPAAGASRLVVRAWDGEGQLQDPTDRDSFPNGATGYHRLTVKVV